MYACVMCSCKCVRVFVCVGWREGGEREREFVCMHVLCVPASV